VEQYSYAQVPNSVTLFHALYNWSTLSKKCTSRIVRTAKSSYSFLAGKVKSIHSSGIDI